MELKVVDVLKDQTASIQTKQLYLSAFPVEERPSYERLLELSKSPLTRFYAYYDQDQYIGLSYLVVEKDLVYLFFLAVNNQYRSMGYGSLIIRRIKNLYPNYQIIINLEPLVPANNYHQRLKRFKFYEDNGFIKLDYQINEAGLIYDMMVLKDKSYISKERYLQLTKAYYGTEIFNYVYKEDVTLKG